MAYVPDDMNEMGGIGNSISGIFLAPFKMAGQVVGGVVKQGKKMVKNTFTKQIKQPEVVAPQPIAVTPTAMPVVQQESPQRIYRGEGNIIKGIDNKYLIYGGAGLGGVVLLTLLLRRK